MSTLFELWPLWLPLVAGGLAVFWLLPRPRAYPVFWGALAGALALLLAGGLVVRAGALTVESALFYVFSGLAVVSGVLLVTQSNPARAALSFALVVLSTCGLFLLLAAPFLMAATIIIYAGAIVVTFLFVLMLAQQEGPSDADARSREPLLATVTGFVLLGALLYVLQVSYPPRDDAVERLLERTRRAMAQDDFDEMNRVVQGAEDATFSDLLYLRYKEVLRARGYFDLAGEVDTVEFLDVPRAGRAGELRERLRALEAIALQASHRRAFPPPREQAPLSGLSGPPPSARAGELRRDPQTGLPQMPAENSAYLGRSLFTDYLLPVELAGTLLLVAAVGAIAIAHRRGGPERPARVTGREVPA